VSYPANNTTTLVTVVISNVAIGVPAHLARHGDTRYEHAKQQYGVNIPPTINSNSNGFKYRTGTYFSLSGISRHEQVKKEMKNANERLLE
jgi:hypothetical protein